MEYGKFQISDENFEITVKGNYEEKFAHFGGLELQLRAIKELIDGMDFKFAEESDMFVSEKIYRELLSFVAKRIRDDKDFETDLTDKELIQETLNEWKD